MFDDIGNLVYIIVFAIWFLYRVFGKGGKKTSKPMPPFDSSAPVPNQESQRPTATFEDVIRELTGAPPPVVEKETKEFDELPELYPVEEISENMEETSFEVYDPPKVVEPTPKFLIKGRFHEFKNKRKPGSKAARKAIAMFRNKQGAKQAFIMKEIFERPYR